MKPALRLIICLCLPLLLSSCQWFTKRQLDSNFGVESPVPRVSLTADAALYHKANQVLEQRCVVCHSCYDAPCQLKLSAIEGLDRGASEEKVYNGFRLIASEPSRLFEDGATVSEWRHKGFFPVLNEREQTPENNLNLSVLYRLLQLKKLKPLPDDAVLSDDFDFSLNRKAFCPKLETLDDFALQHPLWGMPYGLPAISKTEFNTLENWLQQGAQVPLQPTLPKAIQQQIRFWEDFFNGSSLKQKLVNRYLYEHLYLAHFYFDEADPSLFFRVVRSSTPPGQPIRVIATRRVYDDPQKPFYYRLQKIHWSIIAKTHMPYALNQKRYERWQQLFYQTDYQVTELPDYDEKKSSNPFRVFKDIPMVSRYKFLLDEAQYSIMNFIKGPVCRGQIALDVINDHFWVAFLNPDLPGMEKTGEFLKQNTGLLRFPAYWESNNGQPWKWYDLAKRQKEFLDAKAAFMNHYLGNKLPVDMNLIWDGSTPQGFNDNAMLTIFRHFDSATVIKGAAGAYPKTAWIIDYPLLERIHYLLVAGFDVNGNMFHQLLTRLYMDFLRMEGESNFITMLPKEDRKAVQHSWYLDVDYKVDDYFDSVLDTFKNDTDIAYKTNNSKDELMQLLQQHTQAQTYVLKPADYPGLEIAPLNQLNQMVGENISYLPQASVLLIENRRKAYWFSLIHHNAHEHITEVFVESKARMPELDNLTVMPGIVSAYPNAFYHIKADEIDDFAAAIGQLTSEQDYSRFMARFGVRRTNKDFWTFSDRVHEYYKHAAGVEYGLLDYNRLENR